MENFSKNRDMLSIATFEKERVYNTFIGIGLLLRNDSCASEGMVLNGLSFKNFIAAADFAKESGMSEEDRKKAALSAYSAAVKAGETAFKLGLNKDATDRFGDAIECAASHELGNGMTNMAASLIKGVIERSGKKYLRN